MHNDAKNNNKGAEMENTVAWNESFTVLFVEPLHSIHDMHVPIKSCTM